MFVAVGWIGGQKNTRSCTHSACRASDGHVTRDVGDIILLSKVG